MTGRLIKEINGTSEIGENEIEFNPENITKGIYRVTMVLDEKYTNEKLVVE